MDGTENNTSNLDEGVADSCQKDAKGEKLDRNKSQSGDVSCNGNHVEKQSKSVKTSVSKTDEVRESDSSSDRGGADQAKTQSSSEDSRDSTNDNVSEVRDAKSSPSTSKDGEEEMEAETDADAAMRTDETKNEETTELMQVDEGTMAKDESNGETKQTGGNEKLTGGTKPGDNPNGGDAIQKGEPDSKKIAVETADDSNEGETIQTTDPEKQKSAGEAAQDNSNGDESMLTDVPDEKTEESTAEDSNSADVSGDLLSSFVLAPDSQESTTLICQQCVKTFEVTEEFQEHVLGHLVQDSLSDSLVDEDGWATCPVCQQMFPEMAMFEEHVRNHVNNIFTCSVCEMTFRERKSLEDHVSKIHNRDRPFKCSECSKMFKTMVQLGKHLKNAHQKELSLCCDHCSFTCTSRDEFKLHMKEKHRKARSKSKKFTCETCSQMFSSKKQLKSHVNLEHSEPDADSPMAVEEEATPKAGETLRPAIVERKRSSSALEDEPEVSGAKRRKSTRIKKLESKIFMCTLCSERFETEEEWHGHVIGRHGAVVDDFGNVIYQKKERSPQQRKPRPKSVTRKNSTSSRSSSNSREKAESPVYLGLEDAESSEDTPEDSQDEDYQPGMEDETCARTPKKRVSPKSELAVPQAHNMHNAMGLECEICYVTFGSPMLLKKHVMKNHAQPIKKIGAALYCPYCTKQFLGESDVDRHITLYHPLKDIIEKAKTYSKLKTGTPNMSVKHTDTSFLEAYKVNLDLVNKSNGAKDDRIYNCHLCTKSVGSMSDLLSHIRIVHQNVNTPKDPNVRVQPNVKARNLFQNLQMPDAPVVATAQRPLKPQPTSQAIAPALNSKPVMPVPPIRPNPPVVATANNYPRPNPTISRAPIKKVVKQFYYACSVCEAVFPKEAELEAHISSIHQIQIVPNHKEKRPYPCTVCAKRFMHLNSVLLHIILCHHKDGLDNVQGPRSVGLPGAEPAQPQEHFKCPVCSQEFRKKYQLENHVKKNSCRPSSKPKRVIMHGEDERPLPCPRCNGKYWGKSYLYLHIVEGHGNAAFGDYVQTMKKDEGEREDPVVPAAPKTVHAAPKPVDDAPYPVALYQVNRANPFPNVQAPMTSTIAKQIPAQSSNVVVDLTDDDPVEGTSVLSKGAAVSRSSRTTTNALKTIPSVSKATAAKTKPIPTKEGQDLLVDLTEDSDEEGKGAA